MTPDERVRMERLCKQIQEEKNPSAFNSLIQELLVLLDGKKDRIQPTGPAQAS
jgi:hypothetical protein